MQIIQHISITTIANILSRRSDDFLQFKHFEGRHFSCAIIWHPQGNLIGDDSSFFIQTVHAYDDRSSTSTIA